jgi:hypothetical protein
MPFPMNQLPDRSCTIAAGIAPFRRRAPGRTTAAAVVGALAAIVGLNGCAATQGPQVVAVDAAHYEVAFDAAVEAVRRQGLPATIRNRRGGVIETEPAVAGSLLEPWKGGNASLGQAMDNTMHLQRRRVRFEFTPVGFDPAAAALGREPTGPQAVTAAEVPDLTAAAADLELRVWVVLERCYIPGIQLNTWTQSLASRTTIVPIDAEDEPLPVQHWTAFARDEPFERRLLAQVQEAINQP